MRVAVIGGGISGLAAAYRIHELDPTLHLSLYEMRSSLGGALRTERADGFLIEHSADMFSTAEPWALNLCERIGLVDELIETNPRFRRALVVKRGRLHPVPEGFSILQPRKAWPILTSRLLPLTSKARLIGELFVPPRYAHTDESLESFAVRRFGRGVFRWLIQPLVGGIYTADPACLSMAATLQRFRQLETEYGSLIRAAIKSRKNASIHENAASGARYGLFAAPRLGMEQLVETIAARLPVNSINLSHRVTSLTRADPVRWRVTTCCGEQSSIKDFDAVIVATPAGFAARLVESSADELARLLRTISHASAAVAVFGYRRAQIQHPMDAFGFVVPLAEKRDILSASFASVKFADRAPDDSVLIRVFLGGACQPHLLEKSDEQLLAIAARELTEILGVHGAPQLTRLLRWHDTMPQYHVGHLDRVLEIERLVSQMPSFAIAGNAYRGVGIPFCIRSGELAAERVHHLLQQRRT